LKFYIAGISLSHDRHLGESNMKTNHYVQTVMAHCFVMFCTNDWRYKDEHREIASNQLHFHHHFHVVVVVMEQYITNLTKWRRYLCEII